MWYIFFLIWRPCISLRYAILFDFLRQIQKKSVYAVSDVVLNESNILVVNLQVKEHPEVFVSPQGWRSEKYMQQQDLLNSALSIRFIACNDLRFFSLCLNLLRVE